MDSALSDVVKLFLQACAFMIRFRFASQPHSDEVHAFLGRELEPLAIEFLQLLHAIFVDRVDHV